MLGVYERLTYLGGGGLRKNNIRPPQGEGAIQNIAQIKLDYLLVFNT